MVDIGFTELMLAAVVGLLVIGPEQLPSTIRAVALWVGKVRKGFNKIKEDLEQEIGLNEISGQLRNESILADFEEKKEQLRLLDNNLRQGNTNFLNSLIKDPEEKCPDEKTA